MRRTRVWARLLGLQGAVVEGVDTGSEGEVVVTGELKRGETVATGGEKTRPSVGRLDGRRWGETDGH